MASFKLDVYSHYFKISGYSGQGKYHLVGYCMQRLGQVGVYRKYDGSFEKKLLRIYGATRKDRQEYRFHINCLNDFKAFLKSRGYTDNDFETVEHPLYTPALATLKDVSGMEPRDYQPPIINYIAEPNHLAKSKMVVVQMGKGKSYMSMMAAVIMQQRGLIVLKGMYVDRWMADLRAAKKKDETSILGLKPGELLLVRGSTDLKRLFVMAENGELKAKIIVITNKTLYNYIDHYETFNTVEGEYLYSPDQMCEKLRVGWRLIDEVHQDFHLNFRLDLYTHCPKVIALSATMTSDNSFINRMYDIAYPKDQRYGGLAYDKYVDVIELIYHLNFPTKLKWLQRGMRSYSHVAYEESIMKNKDSQRKYINMILRIVQESFMSKMVPGQKLLIYVATVAFADILTKAIREKILDSDVKINKYTAEDEYVQLMTSDISVSTLLSAGTAVDIPGLRVVLMTTALSSTQANLQAFGRLRQLKLWPDVTPEFIYLTCHGIEKHKDYGEKKKDVLKDVALTQRSLILDDVI